jgi:hypothetical protein
MQGYVWFGAQFKPSPDATPSWNTLYKSGNIDMGPPRSKRDRSSENRAWVVEGQARANATIADSDRDLYSVLQSILASLLIHDMARLHRSPFLFISERTKGNWNSTHSKGSKDEIYFYLKV